MNTITIKISETAFGEINEFFAEQTGQGNEVIDLAWEACMNAERIKAGRGHTYKITASVEQWQFIAKELLYGWERNGGQGDPYGVLEDHERGDYGYAKERNACKVAYLRVMAALKK